MSSTNRASFAELATITAGTVKAQNAAFFGVAPTTVYNDLAGSSWRVHLMFNALATIQYTVDNGANWLPLNSGAQIQAGSFRIPRQIGGQLNFRCTDGGGTTILRCDVHEDAR